MKNIFEGGLRLYTNKLFAENLSFQAGLGYRIEREEDFIGGTTVYMRKAI